VNIDDRIVLTGAFDSSDPDIGSDLEELNVGAAQFFTNALDTRTRGLDVVLNYAHVLGEHSLRAQLAGNFNHMELGDIHTTARLAGKEDIYFGPREQAFLIASAPSSKIGLSLDHAWSRLNSNLRITRYGDVTLRNWNDGGDVPEAEQVDDYEAAFTVDASVSYRLMRNASVTFGGTNLFNQYPTMQDLALTETGGPWDAVQMGFSGAFYFLKLNVTR
jgi:iron complex outermembrane recepter protein